MYHEIDWSQTINFAWELTSSSIQSIHVISFLIDNLNNQQNNGNYWSRHTIFWGQSKSLLRFRVAQGITVIGTVVEHSNIKHFCYHNWRFKDFFSSKKIESSKLVCFLVFCWWDLYWNFHVRHPTKMFKQIDRKYIIISETC